MERWSVRLLGSLSARHGDQIVSRFRTQKTAALFAYLAYHLDKPHAREVLADIFWPNLAPDAAKLSLNTAVHSLRNQLEPATVQRGSVLMGDRFQLQLNPAAIETDVARFESALDQARTQPHRMIYCLKQAIGEYGGDLLSGFYEEWIHAPRMALGNAYRKALGELAELLCECGEAKEAVHYSRLAIETDSLDEGLRLTLMRSLAEAGRPDEARETFQEYADLLRRELGLDPSDHALAQLESIGTLRPKSKVVAAPHLPEQERIGHVEGNLPIQFTRFFGRSQELGHIVGLLESGERLITLTGIGGAGKTRLAIEVGRSIRERFRAGVWFVALADISDDDRIIPALRDALGLPRTSHIEPLDQIRTSLAAGPSLVILDNLEQLPAVGAGAAIALLKTVPSIQILSSSRKRVNVAGEVEFRVPPLPVPADQSDTPLEAIAEIPSVRLFVDRAQSALPDFQLTSRLAPAITTLCRGLEGIPLALELAAAKAQTMTLSQMVDGLSARLAIEALPKSGREPRHRSLAAALEWSYDLLTERLQDLFAVLSVFRGGFAPEAAQHVAALPLADVLEGLAHLRSQSLLVAEEAAGSIRYRMLEVMREFGLEKLDSARTALARARHADYFHSKAVEAEREFEGPNQTAWMDAFAADHENFRLTAEYWIETGNGPAALQFGGSIWKYWLQRGHHREGRNLLEQFIALPGAQEPTADRGHALNGLGNLLYSGVDLEESVVRYEEALSIRIAVGDTTRIAGVLNNLANSLTAMGELDRACDLLLEALEIRRSEGVFGAAAVNLNNLGRLEFFRQNFDAARAAFFEALEMDRELGIAPYIAYDLTGLGIVDFFTGDFVTAIERLEEGRAMFLVAGNLTGAAMSQSYLCRCILALGDRSKAADNLREALTIAKEQGLLQRIILTIEYAVEFLLAGSQPEPAARLIGAADSLRSRYRFHRAPCDAPYYDRAIAAAKEAVGQGRYRELINEGSAMGLDEAAKYALDLL